MTLNRDRRQYRLNSNGSSMDQNYTRMEKRSGVERRIGMDRRYEYDDQRALERYKLNAGASVIIKQHKFFNFFRSRVIKFAVVDISAGGLGAQYSASDIFSCKQDKLSIVTDDGIVKIENISFKIINDYKFTRLTDNKYLRRCGIKFENLSDNHKLQLNRLIRDYSGYQK